MYRDIPGTPEPKPMVVVYCEDGPINDDLKAIIKDYLDTKTAVDGGFKTEYVYTTDAAECNTPQCVLVVIANNADMRFSVKKAVGALAVVSVNSMN